ncbi:hypothetical protein QYM36_016624 [Artemia franciscana]|uniref:Phosphoglucomutase n=1 Tax=Artemia franciscana TaxID=6661 RepID=A0AA88HBA0_ARTSF|nr:hypothetical protein QYM36_016624 [Artemia franciscana]
MASKLDYKVEEWLRWDKNSVTRSEVKTLVDKNDNEALNRIIMKRLEFGTAGLRGRMAAGYGCMNDLVIIQTSQGFASYLLKTNPDCIKSGVVVGFDGRHNSLRFAALTARAFINKGIPVQVFSKICPTPFVPYTILMNKLAAGIMITASHNPKEDNGYKVYWSNGAQIIPPHDKGIQSSILENLEPWKDAWAHENIRESPLCTDGIEIVMDNYYKCLAPMVTYPDLNRSTNLRFVYTPVHGVGAEYMSKAFEFFKLPSESSTAYVPTEEQILPDPEFSTVKFPNPEEGKSTLDLAIQTAERNKIQHIIANDPDADRMAFAEKQIGTKKNSELADIKDCCMVASTVSSKILRSIGKQEGFQFEETLTGFKWIANRALEVMASGKTVLFGFEEAIGFMVGVQVLDKDGISAGVKMCELACYLAKQGKTVNDKLLEIYKQYGYHVSLNSYYICHEQSIIKKIFERLRNFYGPNTYPKSIMQGKYSISSVRDLTTGYDDSMPDKKAILPVSKSSQMITFSFANGLVATLRTSGTEPKIKYYTELCAKPGDEDWNSLEGILGEMVTAMVDEFLQPKENSLIPKSD